MFAPDGQATRYSDVHTGTHPNNASHEAQYLARAKSLLAEEIDKVGLPVSR